MTQISLSDVIAEVDRRIVLLKVSKKIEKHSDEGFVQSITRKAKTNALNDLKSWLEVKNRNVSDSDGEPLGV